MEAGAYKPEMLLFEKKIEELASNFLSRNTFSCCYSRSILPVLLGNYFNKRHFEFNDAVMHIIFGNCMLI